MKKLARDLKKNDKIKMAGKNLLIQEIELSDIGKQGKSKTRIVALTELNEKIVIIRPEDYPFETI